MSAISCYSCTHDFPLFLISFLHLNFPFLVFFYLILFSTVNHLELVFTLPLPPHSAQTVAVIVRLEKENFQVLNMHGKLVHVKPQAVHKKKENRRAMALDSEQNTIQVKDVVKVIDGPHSVSLLFIFIFCCCFCILNILLSLFIVIIFPYFSLGSFCNIIQDCLSYLYNLNLKRYIDANIRPIGLLPHICLF